MSWKEFLAMGGYGFYVWSTYTAAAVILLLNVFIPLRRTKTVLKMLREFYRLKGSSK